MDALLAVLALLAGGVLGFWLKAVSQKRERAQCARREQEQTAEVATLRARLDRLQSELAASAGHERVAEERARANEQVNAEVAVLRGEAQARQMELAHANSEIARLGTELANERKNAAEKVALLTEARQALTDQFKAAAGDLLKQTSQEFTQGSQEKLGALLTPLREQIEGFRTKVEEAQKDSAQGVTKLETLVGALGSLNQQLAQEAQNLTTALRGSSKAQGDWGEFILRDLLEKAGLREGEEYSFQQTFPSMEVDGERVKSPRTDVIVTMPGGRNLVIDSKVSLNAYTDSVSAASDEARQQALAEHVKSVRRHVGLLAKSGYHQLPGVEAPDFVVMFVPVEPAFLTAIQADAQLWADAYQQRILLVGPTTLLYVIRIVSELWRQEVQARSVREVMARGTALYEKFVGFVGDLEKVGSNLRGADQSYQNAMKKLSEGRGNLIRQVEELKKLGVRSGKQLPQALLDSSGADESLLELPASAGESEE